MYFTSKYFNDTILFKAKDIVLSDLGIVQYKKGLASALSKQDVKNIILNFKRVKINNSNGLSTLLLAKRYSQGKGGKCTLAFPQPKVVSCMKKAGIYQLFRIINDKNEYQMMIKKIRKVNEVEKPSDDKVINKK